jgi:hypothetical protein
MRDMSAEIARDGGIWLQLSAVEFSEGYPGALSREDDPEMHTWGTLLMAVHIDDDNITVPYRLGFQTPGMLAAQFLSTYVVTPHFMVRHGPSPVVFSVFPYDGKTTLHLSFSREVAPEHRASAPFPLY